MAIGRGEVGPEKHEKCHVPHAVQLQALEHKTRVLCVPACVGVVDVENARERCHPVLYECKLGEKAEAACGSKIG